MATMRHNFEEVSMIFCDEISMVGSSKLTKINYRLQDLFDGNRRKEYMGGISFIASGNLFLIPFKVYNLLLYRRSLAITSNL